jgi:hypothetical protein
MRKPDTTGEYAIPNVETRGVSRTEELPLDSDAFAGFYQRSMPALRAYLTTGRLDWNPLLWTSSFGVLTLLSALVAYLASKKS